MVSGILSIRSRIFVTRRTIAAIGKLYSSCVVNSADALFSSSPVAGVVEEFGSRDEGAFGEVVFRPRLPFLQGAESGGFVGCESDGECMRTVGFLPGSLSGFISPVALPF